MPTGCIIALAALGGWLVSGLYSLLCYKLYKDSTQAGKEAPIMMFAIPLALSIVAMVVVVGIGALQE